ncbi:MAG: hypothetical protein MI741_17770, partial [Rhodospirillales bacterium]|nr:hypothetical protein [Rhodospirillales bacterium]
GGVALAFKVLEYVFSKLSPEEIPQRDKIEVFTAFPGSGAIDGFEMVTRAVTQGRFELDETFVEPRALPAVTGQFYFRITYRGKTLAVSPKAGLIPDRFFELSRLHKAGGATPDDTIEFQGMKEALADALMAAKAEDLFDEL